MRSRCSQQSLGSPTLTCPSLPPPQDVRRTLEAPGRLLDGLALRYAVPPLLALVLARVLALPPQYALG